MTNEPTPAGEASSRYVWYVVILLAVVNMFNFMDRTILSVLLPSIKADLKLSDGQLGLLVGFAFSLFYAICGVPMARWADRGIRRNIIAITLAAWSVMTALSGAAQNFWHLFVARMGVGVGEAGCLPTGQSIICDYVPPKRRAGIYAIHTFGVVVGMMLGMGLGGWLGGTLGWRWTFVVLGVPGILFAVIVRLTLREPVRGFFDIAKTQSSGKSFGHVIGVLTRCPTYRLLVIFLAMNGFMNSGLGQWWPSLFTRVLGMDMSSAGVYLGIALGVGQGLGLLIGGLLANKMAKQDLTLPLKVAVAATFLAIPAALGSLFASSPAVSIVLVTLTCIFWSVHNGPVVAILFGVLQPHMRATGAAISTFFISAVGYGLGPLSVGLLSDLLTPSLGVQALRYALLAPICVLPLMAIALYAAAKQSANDLRAAGIQ